MKVSIYSSDKKSPFGNLYDNLGSSDKFIISNKKKYIEEFEKYQAQLMDLVDEKTDKVIFIPIEAREIFFGWIKENQHVNWQPNKMFSMPTVMPDKIIGEDELNEFIDEMRVEEEWESCEVKPDEPGKEVIPKEVIPDENNQNYFLNLNLRTTVIMIVVVFSVGFLIGFLISFALFCENFSGCNNKGHKVILEQEYGQLTITTALPDSDIYIDNKKQEQKTPVSKMKVLAGKNIQVKIVSIGNIEKCVITEKCATIDLSQDESKSLGDDHFQICN